MKKVIAGLFALVFMTIASVAYAQDSNIEFGVADDLSVLGVEGDLNDADVEIAGFTTLGETSGSLYLSTTVGSIWAAGGIQTLGFSYFGSSVNVVSYGVFGGSVTAAGLDISGWAVFSSTVQINEYELQILGGSNGQVLTKDAAGGGSYWSTIGGTLSGGTNRYIPMWTSADTLSISVMYQNPGTDALTIIGSSLTVEGDFTAQDLIISAGDFQVDAAGNTTIAGTLGVTSGLSSLDGGIDVDGAFTVGDGTGDIATSGDLVVQTDKLVVDSNGVAIGDATPQSNVPLVVEGAGSSGDFAAKFYSGDSSNEANLAAWIKAK